MGAGARLPRSSPRRRGELAAAEVGAPRSGVALAGSGGCAAGTRVCVVVRGVEVRWWRRALEDSGDGGFGRRE